MFVKILESEYHFPSLVQTEFTVKLGIEPSSQCSNSVIAEPSRVEQLLENQSVSIMRIPQSTGIEIIMKTLEKTDFVW